MTRFDGGGDAPLAVGTLCIEPGCAKPRQHKVHDEENQRGHFFYTGVPIESRGPKFTSKVAHPIEELYGTPAERAARRDAKDRERTTRMLKKKASTFVPKARERVTKQPVDENAACTRCGEVKRKGHHRGRGSHTFTTEPAAAGPTREKSIAATIEEAIRAIPGVRLAALTVQWPDGSREALVHIDMAVMP